ncbi:hypothetical protein B1A99_21015 [Cohnella sp. CIP 111063]|uniref:DUF72 domain-containing protein n=1 Tax=unclassified Cohnella TaxID=2636738 RepID=UPI000B8C5466|nr:MULTISPECIES: DUF72 domain-containing protein [unclassified Cohnella]OXS56336.1 hypothetical protein B1A99_21015 [Cohnella sp. CIP 111063]PRX67886.1 uncharacterized protein YecE (DUF72 family) [Cohnella sp. SGD-V74]
MIVIGLTGWGDHDPLYPPGTPAKDKLKGYARHFAIVEMDSAFYAVQPPDRMARYAEETPEGFGFVVKAYQGMTGHLRGKPYYENDNDMYGALRDSLTPLREAGKLTAALFQYPPWFDCMKENVRLLRETKKRMEGFPCALEFRHQSWFVPEMRERTLAFMRDEGWIHSVCDEPQAGVGSIPIVPVATSPDYTLVRLHGRNVGGWNQSGNANWREVRYLYDYNESELDEWTAIVRRLAEQSRTVGVIFNNNSGGHAAGNAKQLMRMLGQPVYELPVVREPEQLDLFNL